MCLVDSLREKPFVIALCETWLTDNDFLDFFSWMGIKKRALKNREKRGGGVVFFVRTGVEFILQDLNSDLKYLTITIWNKLTYFNICTIYRSPNQTYSTFPENLDYLLIELRLLKGNPVIVGDFNFDIPAKDEKPEVLNYKTLSKSFDLDFCLSEPTRVSENSATCIDHFITEDFYPVTVIKTTISDNFALLSELLFTVEMPGKTVIYTRNFKN